MLSNSPSFEDNPVAAVAADEVDAPAGEHPLVITSADSRNALTKSSSEQAIIPKLNDSRINDDEPTVVITTTSPASSPTPVRETSLLHSPSSPHAGQKQSAPSPSLQRSVSEDASDKRKSTKMKAMFHLKSPFKGRKSEQDLNKAAADQGESKNNKKDCSVTVKGISNNNRKMKYCNHTMPLSLAHPQKSKLLKNNIKKNYKNYISPEYARSHI